MLHPIGSASAFEQRCFHERQPTVALSERAKVGYVSTTGIPCSVGFALEHLPPGDQEAFARLLGTQERPGAVASYIFALCKAEREDLLTQASEADDSDEEYRLHELAAAYDVKYQQINKHRGGRCRCKAAA